MSRYPTDVLGWWNKAVGAESSAAVFAHELVTYGDKAKFSVLTSDSHPVFCHTVSGVTVFKGHNSLAKRKIF